MLRVNLRTFDDATRTEVRNMVEWACRVFGETGGNVKSAHVTNVDIP